MGSLASIVLLLAAAYPPERIPPFFVNADDYPAEARRYDIQGDAEYQLAIDTAGKPTNCVITSTAGNDALDRATCRVAMRARFKPALDEQGSATAGHYRDWIPWVLQSRPPARAQGHSINVKFDDSGCVATCRVSRIVYEAVLSPNILRRCDTIGSATIFADYLGRPTKGLKSAAIRTYTTSELSERFDNGANLRRELAVVEFDQDRTGAITRCKVLVPPSYPGADPAKDLCGSGSLQVTDSAGKQPITTKRFTIDAIATLAQ